MKTSHIISIVVIAVALGTMLTLLMDSAEYANFKKAGENPGVKYTVSGSVNKSKPIVYDPGVNANLLEFHMLDHENHECKVILNKSKPQDFERSESVVVKGKMEDHVFYATDILMKCPSKYNEQKAITAN